jgi:hypothetical protein
MELSHRDNAITVGRCLGQQTRFLGNLLNLWKVFERFREAHLKLNPEKCQLLQKEVKYLGHIVSPEGISTDPD